MVNKNRNSNILNFRENGSISDIKTPIISHLNYDQEVNKRFNLMQQIDITIKRSQSLINSGISSRDLEKKKMYVELLGKLFYLRNTMAPAFVYEDEKFLNIKSVYIVENENIFNNIDKALDLTKQIEEDKKIIAIRRKKKFRKDYEGRLKLDDNILYGNYFSEDEEEIYTFEDYLKKINLESIAYMDSFDDYISPSINELMTNHYFDMYSFDKKTNYASANYNVILNYFGNMDSSERVMKDSEKIPLKEYKGYVIFKEYTYKDKTYSAKDVMKKYYEISKTILYFMYILLTLEMKKLEHKKKKKIVDRDGPKTNNVDDESEIYDLLGNGCIEMFPNLKLTYTFGCWDDIETKVVDKFTFELRCWVEETKEQLVKNQSKIKKMLFDDSDKDQQRRIDKTVFSEYEQDRILFINKILFDKSGFNVGLNDYNDKKVYLQDKNFIYKAIKGAVKNNEVKDNEYINLSDMFGYYFMSMVTNFQKEINETDYYYQNYYKQDLRDIKNKKYKLNKEKEKVLQGKEGTIKEIIIPQLVRFGYLLYSYALLRQDLNNKVAIDDYKCYLTNKNNRDRIKPWFIKVTKSVKMIIDNLSIIDKLNDRYIIEDYFSYIEDIFRICDCFKKKIENYNDPFNEINIGKNKINEYLNHTYKDTQKNSKKCEEIDHEKD